MPAVLTTVPDSYQFVMRRYDRNPRLAFRFVCYGENVVSRAIEVAGTIAPTLFLNTSSARDRARKLGWQDETVSFNETQTKSAEPLMVPDKKIRRRRKSSRKDK